MSKELVIGSNRHETKVAILEEDQLVEVYFQRGNEYSLAGSIHKGRVTRVLPGMQSAFVDLGLERDTFLYVSDFFEEENEDIDTVSDEVPQQRPERRDSRRGPERGRGGPERSGSERGGTERSLPERGEPVVLVTESDSSSRESRVRAIDSGSAPLELAGEGDLSGVEEPAGTMAGGERAESDSQRGDRDRNRRGRRRRPRGRGFPDAKYAQPGALAGDEGAVRGGGDDVERAPRLEALPGERIGGGERPAFERAYADRSTLDRIASPERERGSGRRSFDERSQDRTPRIEPSTVEVAAEPHDVIILPGESLAKYRRAEAAPIRSSAPEPAAERFTAERATAEPPAPIEAADVESSDFASDLNVPADEIAVEDLVAEQEAIRDEAEEIELTDRILSHHEVEEVPEEEKLAEFEIERLDDPEDNSVTAAGSVEELREEFTLPFEPLGGIDMTHAVVLDAEPLTTYEASAPLGFDSEADEGDEEQLATEEEFSGQAQVTDSPQTANLRDPNVRSSHRGSRRNRRRRGGNRFGPGTTEAPAVAGLVPAVGVGVSAGAAMALEPVEVRREVVVREPEARAERAERVLPSISDLLKAGQEIIVQIAKEPLGQKGARITSHIALPGRFVVFMPSVGHLGVSRKVASDEERQRLKQILQRHRTGTTGGFIVRTAGEGVPEEEIAADMNFLYNLWLDIRQKAEKKPAPALLHYDLDIVQRILRDHVTEEYKAIWVDNEEMYESVLTFMQRFQPTLVSRVKMYTREAPIFDAFSITQELEKALRPKVWLKSGGYIVINQTEALVAIDINTGKYVGKSNRLEDTIVKTNIEAVKEIVRQIRLRDLGGIIVVDFIDMDERKNRQRVMAALEEAMEADKAPYKILQFNDFGLVAITRKRVKQSLERTLCSPCPYCEGAGYVKSVQTVIGEILVEAQKLAKAMDGKDVVLRVHPDVAKVLKASNNRYLEEIEFILKRPVLVTGDATLHTEKFDLA